MKKHTRILALLMAILMVSCLLAGCGGQEAAPAAQDAPAPAAEPKAEEPVLDADFGAGEQVTGTGEETGSFVRQTAEGTLTIGTNIGTTGFDPLEHQNSGLMMVYDTLLTIDPTTNEIIPWLAESREWTDDYLTCTFHLREGVTFSNGDPLTSEDAMFSLQRIAESASMASSYLMAIDFENSSCPDDLTFIMQMKYVYAQIEYSLAMPGMGVVNKAWVETATNEDWWDKPVGTGPYTVVENVDGSYTKYAAREDYWGGAAEAKEVTIKAFSDSSNEFIAFQSGELDVAMDILGDDLQRIINGEEKDASYVVKSAYDFKIFQLCEYTEELKNENVRKAIAHAIDRQACIDASFGILGSLMDSNMNKSSTFYEPQGTYEYDPELARQMLEAEGYHDGDIHFRLVSMNTTTDQLLAEAIQFYLAQVGITMDIESYVMFTAIPMLRDGDTDVVITGTGGGAYDAAQIFDKIDVNGTDKSTIIHDDELQAAIAAGSATMDPVARAEAYSTAQSIMYEKCYSVPIVEINGAYCYRNYISDFPCITAAKFNAWYCHFA